MILTLSHIQWFFFQCWTDSVGICMVPMYWDCIICYPKLLLANKVSNLVKIGHNVYVQNILSTFMRLLTFFETNYMPLGYGLTTYSHYPQIMFFQHQMYLKIKKWEKQENTFQMVLGATECGNPGGRHGVRTPPLKNHKNIGFLSNLDPNT